MLGSALRVSPGEFGVSGGDCLPFVTTHGEPICADTPSKLWEGVLGILASFRSFTAFKGGDFANLFDPPETRGWLSGFFSLSLSSLSLTASADFLRTSPAASSAVVARCMMLTLPARFFRPLDPWLSLSLSLSLTLPLGVDGFERIAASRMLVDGVGDSVPLSGDLARGGVVDRRCAAVGVAGMNCSSGAALVVEGSNGGGMDGDERPIDRALVSFSTESRDCSAITPSTTSEMSTVVLVTPSSTDFFSALRFNIHHSEPVASHASVKTE